MQWAIVAIKCGIGISVMANHDSGYDLKDALGRIGLNLSDGESLLINVAGSEILMKQDKSYIVDDEVFCFRGAIKEMCESLGMNGSVRICEAPENFMVLGE